MLNEQLFEEKLKQATEIRTYRQDDLRKNYKVYRQVFEQVTGLEGKVLKHLVDMYHYRNGGYPLPSSLPKHQELIEKFVQMVVFFDFVGFSKLYKDELKKYGVTITVAEDFKVPDIEYDEETIEIMQEAGATTNEGLPFKTSKKFIRWCILQCDLIQGDICQASNQIKRDIAEQVQEECEIKKGDFTSSVMVNYQIQANKINEVRVENMVKSFASKVETGNMNIEKAKENL